MKIKVKEVTLTKKEVGRIMEFPLGLKVTNELLDYINRNLKHYIQNSIWFGIKETMTKPLDEWICDGVLSIYKNYEDKNRTELV